MRTIDRTRTILIHALKFLVSRSSSIGFLFLLLILSPSTFAVTGVTYTGRILDSNDQPVVSNQVYFKSVIYDEDARCWLYQEVRLLDLSDSSGTFSFNVGSNDPDLVAGTASYNFGITSLTDVFNNGRTFTGLTGCTSPNSFTPSATSARILSVIFRIGSGPDQALPPLKINPVPSALQAYSVNGYGSGELLKVDPAQLAASSVPNNALNQTQYEEFWKLILGTSTTYLKAIPTLGGDVSGTLPAMSVDKIKGVAVTAPATGDTGKVLTYNGTGMVWQTAASGGITNLNGLTGSTQSFVSGTTPLSISSSGSTHTFNISNASSSTSGLLTSADWNTFSSKQSGSLASGKVWIGNASGTAEAQTLSGDATISASGNVTVDKTQTAAASKILQLDSSGNAYVHGVDIKGSGAVSAQLRYTGSTNMVMNLPTTSGTANQFLQTDGTGNLSWASQSAMLPSISAGQVWVGNASGGAQAFTLSGDIASVSNTGLVTLSASASGSNKLPLAGGSMSGAINMGTNDITNAGNINMAANKYLGLSANSTDGTVAGQVWYDAGVIKYFDGTTVKSLGVAGAGITNLNGLSGATQSFVSGTAGNAPAFSSAGSAHTFNIPMASSSGSVTAGLISNSDYVSFSGKQSNSLASAQVWVGNASGVAQARTLSGDISINNAGVVTADKTKLGASDKLLQLDSSGVANSLGIGLINSGTVRILPGSPSTASYDLKLPVVAPANNQILQSNASGDLSWVTYLAQVSDSAPLANGKMWIGNASGIASEVAMSGDATINNAGILSLKNTGSVGTYFKVVTDAQGRVVSGSALASGDVTTALGYTPVNRAGDTMTGDLGTQNINIAAGKFLGLGSGSTSGTVAGQMWYDGGIVKYFDGTTVKSLGVAGAGITNLNGLSSGTQSFVSGTAGTDFAISSSGSAHTFNLPSASASNRGALTSADWSTFNAKQSSSLASTQVWVGNASGVAQARTLSGDIAIDSVGVVSLKNTGTAGTYYKVVTDAQGRVVSGTSTASATDLPSLSNGNIWIGNSGNTAIGYAMSGDATLSNVGVLTLKNTGSAGTYSKVVTDAQGRIVSGSALASGDVTAALGYTPVNRAGDTMAGALNFGGFDISNAGNISMAAGKFFGLGAGATDGTVAGQMWYDGGVIKYFDGTTVKSLGVAGAGITNLNGLSSGTQSFVNGTAGNSPAFSSAGSAHTLNIPMASSSGSVTAGLISNSDYVSFSGKQSNSLNSTQVWVGNSANVAQARSLSGDITIDNVGLVTANKTTTGQSNKLLSLDGSSVGTMAGIALTNTGTVTISAQTASSTYGLKLPAASPQNNQILKSNASGDLSWVTYLAQVSDSAPLANGKMWIGNASGVASEVAMSGDATISNAGLLTLKNTGSVGTYSKVVTDAQGRVVSGSALASGDVTTALTYTPVNRAGDSMTGDLITQNLSMVANKYFRLSANSTDGSTAGQMWYDSGVIKYFDGTTVKSLGVAGAGITNLNGLSSGTQSFVNGSSGNAPAFSSAGSAHTLNIPMASASGSVTAGLISNADYVNFNSKQSNALTQATVWVGNASGGAESRALSGDVASMNNIGQVTIVKTTTGENNKILALDGSGVANVYGVGLKGATSGTVNLQAAGSTANYSLKLPATTPVANQIMQSDASGNLSWINTPSGATLPSITAGKIWVGNSSGGPEAFSLSGDIASVSNTGLVTLKNTGTVGTYSKVVTDAQGRIVSGSALAAGDITTALNYTPVNRAGDTMTGLLNHGGFDITNTGNITMAANKYFQLSANSTNSSTAGQIWYDSGVIKYYDGTTVKSLGVAGAGITNLNGLSSGTQSFVSDSAGTDFAISSSGSAHTFSLPSASSSNRGALTSADWTTFNNKQSNGLTSAFVWVGNSANGAQARALSGDVTISNVGLVTLKNTGTVGTYFKVVTDAQGRVSSGATLLSADVTAALGFTPGAAGAGITSLNGLSVSSQSFAIGTSGNSPAFSSATSTHTLNIPLAATASVTAGLISNADYASMMGKQSNGLTSAFVWVGNSANGAQARALSGDITISNVGLVTADKTTTGTANKLLALDGTGVANVKGLDVQTGTGKVTLQTSGAFTNYVLTLPNSSGSANQVLQNTGGGVLGWASVLTGVNNTAALTNGRMWLGNASGVATEVAMSGDATITNAGLLTLKNTGTVGTYFKVITDAQGRVSSGATLLSADVVTALGFTPSSGAASLPALTSAQVWVGNSSGGAQARALSGDVTISNVGLMTVDKTQAAAASKILQLSATGTAYTNGVDIDGGGTGTLQLRYPSSSNTITLTFPSTSGSANQFLQTNGTGTLSWASVSSSLPALTSATVWVGNSSGGPQERALSGDLTISNVGLATATKTTTGQANRLLSLDGSSVATASGVALKGTVSGTVTLYSASSTANYSITLPAVAGGASQVLASDGAGNLAWSNSSGAQTVVSKSSNFTVGLSENNYLYAVTGATTATLPTVASVPNGFRVTIKRVGASNVNVKGSGTETIDGANLRALQSAYATLQVINTGTEWLIIGGGAANSSSSCTPGQQAYNTAGTYTYTIPAAQITANCTFTITVKGAGGGNASAFGTGGKGGASQFTYKPSVAGTFEVYVGATASGAIGGAGGGGGGFVGSTYTSGGGGGASAVRYTNTAPTNTLLAIAGGGGGAPNTSYEGGDGGGTGAGSPGTANANEFGYGGGSNVGGAGATSTANGGAGGSAAGNGTQGGGTGGAGGTAVAAFTISGGGGAYGGSSKDGGGGGGGYGGGGGGGNTTTQSGGGGGGGGYINSGAVLSFTDITAASGTPAATAGSVLIEWN